MSKKEEIKIKPFWYSDIWLWPKLITIITTLDKNGTVNAGPYSHIMQYDVMTKNPGVFCHYIVLHDMRIRPRINGSIFIQCSDNCD